MRLLGAALTLPTACVHAECPERGNLGSLGRVLPNFGALCLVPAVGHGETVVHEIAGRVEHVVEQFRDVSAQVFRHFFVGLLQSGDGCNTCVFRNLRGPCTLLRFGRARLRGHLTQFGISTFHQTMAVSAGRFRKSFDRIAGFVEMRVGERGDQTVRPVQVAGRDFRRGVTQVGGRIVDVRIERRGRGEGAGTV